MKKLKLSLWAATAGLVLACITTEVHAIDNVNASDAVRGDVPQLYKHKKGKDTLTKAEIREGVRETGQYNSNIATPKPPNIDAGISSDVPEHTYGDTANRADGLNSVR